MEWLPRSADDFGTLLAMGCLLALSYFVMGL
jgi:hypothetical protein